MDILLQTIISEFSIKAPKDPKNPLRLDLIYQSLKFKPSAGARRKGA
jgi:hypothetical protein